jgi:hypothetical protein
VAIGKNWTVSQARPPVSRNSEETIQIPAGGLSVVVWGWGWYGVCIGSPGQPGHPTGSASCSHTVRFRLVRHYWWSRFRLYVFAPWLARLSLRAMLQLLVASLAVNLAVPRYGTDSAFFSSATTAGPAIPCWCAGLRPVVAQA